MKTVLILILCSIIFLQVDGLGQGGVFYREYWATFDQNASNHSGGRWRINDENLSLHESFGKRSEAGANGLILLNVAEDLFGLDKAELYLELWGGHSRTANKRFYLNGRGLYAVPEVGTEEGNYTYSYPVIPLEISNMVNGNNAFQFACDRGKSFWGHFIIDNASVRCYLKPDNPVLENAGVEGFVAKPSVGGKGVLDSTVKVFLDYDINYKDAIESVDFYGRYLGFDDTGEKHGNGWHGFTYKREPTGHLGTANQPPYSIDWDTRMIPDQDKPMAIVAVVHLKDNMLYRTPVLQGLVFPPKRNSVQIYHCNEMPVPFSSRDSREAVAKLLLPNDLSEVERAQLWIKTWDGGEGSVKAPFTINNYPYNVISGKSNHNVVFTVVEVDLKHIKPGENTIRLFSDTEHHGIEILLPGPCLIMRYKN